MNTNLLIVLLPLLSAVASAATPEIPEKLTMQLLHQVETELVHFSGAEIMGQLKQDPVLPLYEGTLNTFTFAPSTESVYLYTQCGLPSTPDPRFEQRERFAEPSEKVERYSLPTQRTQEGHLMATLLIVNHSVCVSRKFYLSTNPNLELGSLPLNGMGDFIVGFIFSMHDFPK